MKNFDFSTVAASFCRRFFSNPAITATKTPRALHLSPVTLPPMACYASYFNDNIFNNPASARYAPSAAPPPLNSSSTLKSSSPTPGHSSPSPEPPKDVHNSVTNAQPATAAHSTNKKPSQKLDNGEHIAVPVGGAAPLLVPGSVESSAGDMASVSSGSTEQSPIVARSEKDVKDSGSKSVVNEQSPSPGPSENIKTSRPSRFRVVDVRPRVAIPVGGPAPLLVPGSVESSAGDMASVSSGSTEQSPIVARSKNDVKDSASSPYSMRRSSDLGR